jgi:hypothetical protein
MMMSGLEGVKTLLAKDKRLLEITLLFNGQNLKEQFPDLSREERAQMLRMARSLMARLDEGGHRGASPEAADLAAQRERAIQTEADRQFDEKENLLSEQLAEAPAPVLSTETPVTAEFLRDLKGLSADQVSSVESVKKQATPQRSFHLALKSLWMKVLSRQRSFHLALKSLWMKVLSRQSKNETVDKLSSNERRERRLYFAGIFAIVTVGILLIILQITWLPKPVLNWVFDKVSIDLNQSTKLATDDVPGIKGGANSVDSSGQLKAAAKVAESDTNPTDRVGGQIRNVPNDGVDAKPVMSNSEQPSELPNPVDSKNAIISTDEKIRDDPSTQDKEPLSATEAEYGSAIPPLSATGEPAVVMPEVKEQTNLVNVVSQEIPTASEGEGEAKPDEVRQVQLGLVKLGYKLRSIDGILGPRTRAAIRAYQQDHNLAVDGKVSTGLMQSLASFSDR